MEGITKERLIRLLSIVQDEIYRLHIRDLIATECTELNTWQPIDTAPKDRPIRLYAPPYLDLPAIQSDCKWHSDAGFCIDELRTPTHWQELPKDPK